MSIPDYVPEDIAKILVEDAHGISFPCRSGCQMRFIRKKKDLGGFYSYNQWGGIEKALRAAMSRNKQLKALHPTSKIRRVRKPTTETSCGFNGVGYREKIDKRRNEIERFFWVSYRKDDKPAVKTFSLGYTAFDADLHFHAYRTAIQFRQEWDEYGDEMKFDKYRSWRKVRLYEFDYPKFELTRRRRRKGEKLPEEAANDA
ncbi:hypothetical protein [Algibacillus agarilyticus]|uniref:hypothetical protein n=1 Tax=Algibacillus agarilyticus TaxID=2234133 RepID=UPI001E2E82C2|nr:hypothetical protein [Algibacillus agarilyticus]